MNKGLKRAGGAAALAAAMAFLSVFALVATDLAPMIGPDLAFADYLSLHQAKGTLIYIEQLLLYLVFGLALTIMAIALHELLKEGSPWVSRIALALGLMYSGFVILGGMLAIHGDEAVLGLAARDPAGADALRGTISAIALCVDASDRLLGCLWIGLASIAAFRTDTFPRGLAIFGLVIGAPGIIGLALPSTSALSLVFGIGIIVWSAWLGLVLLRRTPA